MTATAAPPLLALDRLAVAYGGIQAVKGIDLVVASGELVCLIGANGAGKTTTLKGVCGLLPVKSGTIRYAGDDITGHPAFELVRRGLAMVPEGRGMFGRHVVGRRAADARDRPRADVAPAAAAAGRAVDGPRAADGAEGVRDDPLSR